MHNYTVVLERSETGFAAFSPDVPGCVAAGATAEETLQEMRAALAFHFDGMIENGEAIPEPMGIEHHLSRGEQCVESGDWVTTIPREELLGAISPEPSSR
jgi:predicted RNase H-like HicB family nuclease